MHTTDTLAPPPGFCAHDRKSPLTDPWEPLFARKTDRAVVLGLRAGPAHANSRGFVHGGLIGALADNAMGLSCARTTGHAGGFVTGAWCGDPECEAKVKAETKATIRYVPLEAKDPGAPCVVCGRPGVDEATWAIAY